MIRHTRKISRMLTKEHDVDKHIHNISSMRLSFFHKLIICRALKFSLPQKVQPRDIKASFEKMYWRLEPHLKDDKKDLAASTLRSIALNYIEKKSIPPPKSLVRALNQLKNREDIVITKPDKGDGVVVMDKSHYLRLLKEASVNNNTKFRPHSTERPKSRGRPPKHYHPLLAKEQHLINLIRNTLPKAIAASLRPKGSRLAHMYGLPKTHKATLSMRPILSSTGTYNFQLAKWLDEKLKPLSRNEYTIDDIFEFAKEIQSVPVGENEVLVSYDVEALFTNIPVDEAIHILADKAFTNNWLNNTYDLALKKEDLIRLLEASVKDQLFQFDGELYEQIDGVAMGSPLGPLLANTFLCSLEDSMNEKDEMPRYYRRYVDDTLAIMPDNTTAHAFLEVLNSKHHALNFTMETTNDNKIAFLGMNILKNGLELETSVYKKPTNTGLLLHFQSHVDLRYKKALIKTMIDRAFKLSSTWKSFIEECESLKSIFQNLQYPFYLINNIINKYINERSTTYSDNNEVKEENTVIRFSLPYKSQRASDITRKEINELASKICVPLQPVFTSRSIGEMLKPREVKPKIVNQQCVIYQFKCGLCDMDYVGYTNRHLHQRIKEHGYSSSSIAKHMSQHGEQKADIEQNFTLLRKCRSKFECLIYEMLYIKDLTPTLNVQTDSMKAKLFQ